MLAGKGTPATVLGDWQVKLVEQNTERSAIDAGRSGTLGDRLTVGQVPLTHSVQVRILVAQPNSRRTGTMRADQMFAEAIADADEAGKGR